MAEFTPYNNEWKKEVSKLNKPMILDLFQSVGREKETIKDLNNEMLEILKIINNIENGAFGLKSFNVEDLKRKLNRLITKADAIFLNHG